MSGSGLDDATGRLWEGFRDPAVRDRLLSCADGLSRKGFEVLALPTISLVNRAISARVDRSRTVYYWNSVLEKIGIIDTLKARGNTVKSSLELSGDRGWSLSLSRRPGRKDVYMTSVAAVTVEGALVNPSPEGAGVFPPGPAPGTIVVTAGYNKIVDDIEDGLQRSRDMCVPQYAGMLGLDLPCVESGHCLECSRPHAMCSINTLVTRRPEGLEVLVILTGERLGF